MAAKAEQRRPHSTRMTWKRTVDFLERGLWREDLGMGAVWQVGAVSSWLQFLVWHGTVLAGTLPTSREIDSQIETAGRPTERRQRYRWHLLVLDFSISSGCTCGRVVLIGSTTEEQRLSLSRAACIPLSSYQTSFSHNGIFRGHV